MAFELVGEQAVLRRASADQPSSLRGLLSDYFSDREDVQHFIDEERRGWTADEESSQE